MSDPRVRFVRDVLGCGCPEEVLRSIDVDRGRRIPDLDGVVTRLAAGGQLLVYVVPLAVRAPSLEPAITHALKAGVVDRDRHGFNRPRAAIVTRGQGPGASGARSVTPSRRSASRAR